MQTCTAARSGPEGAAAVGRARPGGRAAEVLRGHDVGDRGSRAVLRGAAEQTHRGDDPVVGPPAERGRLDRCLRRRPPPVPRTTKHGSRSCDELVEILLAKARRCGHNRSGTQGPAAERRPARRPEHRLAARSRRPTSSATCGRCRPTCAGALPGSAPPRCSCSSGRTRTRGRCPTSRCSTRHASGWAIPTLARRQRQHRRAMPRSARADGASPRRPDRRRRRRVWRVMSMLRGEDLHEVLVDSAALADDQPDALAGPFAHVVVDEAQELTDAEWQMLLRRCPSRSFTIVGDRAQARHGFTRVVARTAGADRARPHHAGLLDASTTGRRRRSWPRPSR